MNNNATNKGYCDISVKYLHGEMTVDLWSGQIIPKACQLMRLFCSDYSVTIFLPCKTLSLTNMDNIDPDSLREIKFHTHEPKYNCGV